MDAELVHLVSARGAVNRRLEVNQLHLPVAAICVQNQIVATADASGLEWYVEAPLRLGSAWELLPVATNVQELTATRRASMGPRLGSRGEPGAAQDLCRVLAKLRQNGSYARLHSGVFLTPRSAEY